MRLIQLVDFIESITGKTAYPLQFPHNEDEECVVVDIINGDFQGEVTTTNFQVMLRSSHPGMAEEMANTLLNILHNLTNRIWEDQQVILLKATSPNPFFNGQDENERYLYTLDFRLLTTKV